MMIVSVERGGSHSPVPPSLRVGTPYDFEHFILDDTALQKLTYSGLERGSAKQPKKNLKWKEVHEDCHTIRYLGYGPS